MGDSILFLAEEEGCEVILNKKMTKQRIVKVNKVYYETIKSDNNL